MNLRRPLTKLLLATTLVTTLGCASTNHPRSGQPTMDDLNQGNQRTINGELFAEFPSTQRVVDKAFVRQTGCNYEAFAPITGTPYAIKVKASHPTYALAGATSTANTIRDGVRAGKIYISDLEKADRNKDKVLDKKDVKGIKTH
ncbi:hypothetical protein CMO92_05240 [Candidatus Woesearchaeota archaeon]|nr:hypothetical protein [Candidatus Woesearchaeota archaeon]